MNVDLIQQFRQLVENHAALNLHQKDLSRLEENIRSRMKHHQLSSPEVYYSILAGDSSEARDEWNALTPLLTTGESYFFRDNGQITLLREVILPELIQSRRIERTLRIWSAGCSTGEEPYTLAMLVDELLPDRENWNIHILGTDINTTALGYAKDGVYRDWSFRGVNPRIRDRYFNSRNTSWQINPEIRDMVRLFPVNLLKDTFPNATANLIDMDLIICRNVFIYFRRDNISVILKKLTHTLKENGYLLTGHSEIQDLQSSQLHINMYSTAAIYQRRRHSPAASLPPIAVENRFPDSAAALNSNRDHLGNQVLRSPRAVNETVGIPRPTVRDAGVGDAKTDALEIDPAHCEELHSTAQALANAGQYESARHHCRQALEADIFAVKPYCLLAGIADELGEFEEAKKLWKTVIYLVPGFVAAYIELGLNYSRERDTINTRRMHTAALRLLREMAPLSILDHYGETAASMILSVEKMLSGNN